MSHEGRMSRGEEKLSKGLQDIEVAYFLANKPKPVEAKPEPKKEVKEAKDVKPNK